MITTAFVSTLFGRFYCLSLSSYLWNPPVLHGLRDSVCFQEQPGPGSCPVPSHFPLTMNLLRRIPSLGVILVLLITCTSPVGCFIVNRIVSVQKGVGGCHGCRLNRNFVLNDKTSEMTLIEYHGWNESKSFVLDPSSLVLEPVRKVSTKSWLRKTVYSALLPSGEFSKHYFQYIRWRSLQRLISSTNNVFGTQALLLSLGVKRSKIGSTAAATWILKDTVGKLARVLWASGFGRQFDSNAKKWRFKAALLYAFGNALEVSTLLFPSSFFVTAALGNAVKQVAMLTASSTRNTIYKSFSAMNDNIGDVTAKGEAQIAIIDIIGMVLGVAIGRLVDGSRDKILSIFFLSTMLELICVYREIQSVVFRTLNFERCCSVLPAIVDDSTVNSDAHNFKPSDVARNENLLLQSRVDETVIKVWSTLSQDGLQSFINKREAATGPKPLDNFIVLFSVRPPSNKVEEVLVRCGLLRNRLCGYVGNRPAILSAEVLLHHRATSLDLFRALIIIWKAFNVFEHGKYQAASSSGTNPLTEVAQQLTMDAYAYEQSHLASILKSLESLGWDSKHFSFGALRLKVDY